jgi:HupE / UreJ protein
VTTHRPSCHRLVLIAAALVSIAAVSLATAPQASAHPISTSAVLLDVGGSDVTASIDLPLDQLSIAFDEELSARTVMADDALTDLRSYVEDHVSATDSTGRTWTTEVTGGHVEQIDGTDNLVLSATLTPSSGAVGDFKLHYDAVVDRLISHRVFLFARYGSSGAYTTLAMLSWQTTSVPVASAGTSPISNAQGFVAAVHLGVDHISGGSDHLLFLIMLLLPAPLAASGRRGARRHDLGRAGWRVVHVVTAFAVGHSITLALGALGWIHLPSRLVESGIALSVLVSAIHAIRPLVRRGEVLIAATFGLLHGLAFAALLGELNLSRSGLVSTLLGFNLGIEITQLMVVALVMPSLVLISRTSAYASLRIGLAALGAMSAAAWFAQRTGLVASNPLEPVGEVLVRYPLALAVALAAIALACTTVHHWPHRPTRSTGPDRTEVRPGSLLEVTNHEPTPTEQPATTV